jgi:adenosylmethionine-8-amino-7-oxononanoate aminotransferase
MLTGGHLPLASTLVSKKVYDAFLGDYSEMMHLFHGHTFTGNPLACAVANENLRLYEKSHLIKKIQKTSRVFEKRLDEISEIGFVGDVRYKGMLMGIELVKNKKSKKLVSFGKSANKIIFDEAKRHKIYLRSLGNIVMLVPPLAISEDELNLLIDGTISTIKNIQRK